MAQPMLQGAQQEHAAGHQGVVYSPRLHLASGAVTRPVCEQSADQRRSMEFEAHAAKLCMPLMVELGQKHPLWMAHYDDVEPDTADIESLFGLLETAPTDFARGLIFGKLNLRSQLAAVTGRPF